MLLGKICGKCSTNTFDFFVEEIAQKFEYVQVKHPDNFYVLAQIVEIEKSNGETKAKCNVLGYRSKGILRNLRTPLEPGSEVHFAEDDFIKSTLDLKKDKYGAYMGILEGRDNIPVFLDMNKMISKHVAVLARTGAGKSYCLSVLLEEVMQKNVPIVVIDPHGEYASLKKPTEEKNKLERFGIEAFGFGKRVVEFSPDIEKNPEALPLKLTNENLTGRELMHMLPAKLSNSQIGLLYTALKDIHRSADFDDLLVNLQMEEHGAKWAVINLIEYMKKLDIFSKKYTALNDLVRAGRCSVINLRGVPTELQEIVVYKLSSDLFNARKKGEIPPFFLVVEEAHNFCPERSFGEAKSSRILRQIVAEGRKFGLGMAVVTQRPARVEKTVLSQCNTQVILKVTNPNDLKAISNSVEGITSETEKEIRNLHIGKAMLVGVVDLPLFVEVRPKMTKHGGEAINIIDTFIDLNLEDNVFVGPKEKIDELVKEEEKPNKDLLNVVVPKFTKQNIIDKSEKDLEEIKTILNPCLHMSCLSNGIKFNLLINLNNGHIVTNIVNGNGLNLNAGLQSLASRESNLLGSAIACGKSNFSAAELFSLSGMQFSEVFDLTNTLVKKGYLVADGSGRFDFTDSVLGLIKLNKYNFLHKLEFRALEYDSFSPIIVDKHNLIKFLKTFVNVVSYKDCYLVTYDITYADEPSETLDKDQES